MGGNLLRREVTADDVARAFLHLALARSTTGSIRDRGRRQSRRGAALKFRCRERPA